MFTTFTSDRNGYINFDRITTFIVNIPPSINTNEVFIESSILTKRIRTFPFVDTIRSESTKNNFHIKTSSTNHCCPPKIWMDNYWFFETSTVSLKSDI